jgi:hypothetical protein
MIDAGTSRGVRNIIARMPIPKMPMSSRKIPRVPKLLFAAAVAGSGFTTGCSTG